MFFNKESKIFSKHSWKVFIFIDILVKKLWSSQYSFTIRGTQHLKCYLFYAPSSQQQECFPVHTSECHSALSFDLMQPFFIIHAKPMLFTTTATAFVTARSACWFPTSVPNPCAHYFSPIL